MQSRNAKDHWGLLKFFISTKDLGRIFRGKYFEVEKDKHKDRSIPGALKKTRRAEEEGVGGNEEEIASE